MITWGIVGLGWLGGELARVVTADGDRAWGTHRADFTFGRDPFPVRACDVLVLNTPPLVTLAPDDFVRAVRADDGTRLIFVSSTSVYGAAEGTAERTVDENDPVTPATDGARWLVAVEAALRARFGTRVSVVRPGGLIGGTRHPVFALTRSGRVVEDGPVNLIHREDLIGILRTLARAPEPLVNAVAPAHPPKSIYYGEWARRLGLGEVRVSPATNAGRRVTSAVLPRLYPAWRCPRLDRLG